LLSARGSTPAPRPVAPPEKTLRGKNDGHSSSQKPEVIGVVGAKPRVCGIEAPTSR